MQEIGIFQVIHTTFIAPFMVINIRMVIFCRPLPLVWQNSANYVALLCQHDGITLPSCRHNSANLLAELAKSVTIYGVKPNAYSGHIQKEVVLEDLFK